MPAALCGNTPRVLVGFGVTFTPVVTVGVMVVLTIFGVLGLGAFGVGVGVVGVPNV